MTITCVVLDLNQEKACHASKKKALYSSLYGFSPVYFDNFALLIGI